MKSLPLPSNKPNSISTQHGDSKIKLDPIKFIGSPAQAWNRLKRVLHDIGRTVIIEDKDNFMRAETRSAFFGFIDDIVFSLDEKNFCIHCWSSSRIGYIDFGVNKRRYQKIKNLFESKKTF